MPYRCHKDRNSSLGDSAESLPEVAVMKLKQKQKAFIAEYVENGGNGVQAALKVYDTEDYNTANQIARDNLQKPTIMREIEKQMNDTGLTVKKALNAINDGYAAEKKGDPDHNVRLRSADMTLKLADAYPSRAQEVNHKHAHLHLKMVNELSEKYSFDELTEMMKEEMRHISAEEIAASPTLQHIGQGLLQDMKEDELSEDSTEGNIAKE